MRVLLVNHYALTPAEGGGTRHFEMGRELVARGWEVEVAASDFHLFERRYTRRRDASDRGEKVEAVEGVRFRWLWAAPYRANDLRRLHNWLSFARSLGRSAGAGLRPDVVVGSSPHLLAAWGALRLARRWRVPFVLEVRDLWPESLEAVGARHGAAYRGLGMLARHLYRRADRILVLAEGTAEYLREHGVPARKLAFVPNGVDLNGTAEVKRVPRTRLTLIYTGAHGPANGLEAVLDAAERLRHYPDISFLLVGDGPVKATLAADAGRRGLGNVSFHEPVPKAAIAGLLQDADAGLMVLRPAPLFAFGVSPNKLFDYMGAALPVVCNVPGEVARVVAAAGAGEQAVNPSGDALADAILRLYRCSPEQRLALGRNGRAWVARERSRPQLAQRFEAVLKDAASAAARGVGT